jgi:diguanylate cyclase (GGDEF)-like protein/PAS domain S-box-containing protein
MPEDVDIQSLFYSAFANSDSLAILCSSNGVIKSVSEILAKKVSVTPDKLIGQQILFAPNNEVPSDDWTRQVPRHQKEFLLEGTISIPDHPACFSQFNSAYVKKLTSNDSLIGYQLKLAHIDALQSMLPQKAWLQLFNDSTDGVVLLSESLNILSSNKAFNKLVGVEKLDTNTIKMDRLFNIDGPFSNWLTNAKELSTAAEMTDFQQRKHKVLVSVTPFDLGNKMFFWCFIHDLSNTTKLKQQLSNTLSRFKTLFDNNRDGIALIDLHGSFIEVNQRLAHLLGYERDQLLGRHYSFFNAKHSFELSAAQVRSFNVTGYIPPYEKQLLCKNGKTINVSVQLFPHYAEDGTYSGAWSFVHPISEQEHYLRNQKQRFELLLERSIDAIAYSKFDGTIEIANKAFCDMVGRDAEDIIGANYQIFTASDDIDREETYYKNQLLTRGYTDVYSKNFVLPSGENVPVTIRTVLIRSDSGEPEGVWSISRDNKLRDRLVESLADSEQRFRSLFSNSFDAIALWTPDDELKYANKAYVDLIGYSQQELRNLTFRDFTPAGWEEVDEQMYLQVQERGYSDIVEKEVKRKNGEIVPISIRASGMKDSHGKITGSWVIIRDISDYRTTLKKLEHSQNILSQTSRMSRVGGWELDVTNQTFKFTEETYRILSIPASYNLAVKSIAKVFDPKYEALVSKTVTTAFKTDTHQEIELKLAGFEPERWIKVSAQTGYETNDSKKYLYGAVQDITDFKQKEKTLESDKNVYQQLAFHDSLTQLPNRLLLTDRFKQTTSQAKRDKKIVALLIVDLDDFKIINDQYGHPAGDALLKELSNRFLSSIRANDTVARLGGDEFVIIACLDSEADIPPFAQKILLSLGQTIQWQNHQFVSTASIGIAFSPKHGNSFDSLYSKADKALYSRKHQNKNGFTLAD